METTVYQMTHNPIGEEEIKCIGLISADRHKDGYFQCPKCNRILKRLGLHVPDRKGQFGWIYYFADGSVLVRDNS